MGKAEEVLQAANVQNEEAKEQRSNGVAPARPVVSTTANSVAVNAPATEVAALVQHEKEVKQRWPTDDTGTAPTTVVVSAMANAATVDASVPEVTSGPPKAASVTSLCNG